LVILRKARPPREVCPCASVPLILLDRRLYSRLPIASGRSVQFSYRDFGGLLGGWQEPQGVFFVTLFGVASDCAEP
jgi:hypothetical protein